MDEFSMSEADAATAASMNFLGRPRRSPPQAALRFRLGGGNRVDLFLETAAMRFRSPPGPRLEPSEEVHRHAVLPGGHVLLRNWKPATRLVSSASPFERYPLGNYPSSLGVAEDFRSDGDADVKRMISASRPP
jgi:hypothetical protein